MNKYLRSLVAIPALLGLVAGSVTLPAHAHAQHWGGGPRGGWGGGRHGGWGGGWGGGPGWRHHDRWGGGAIAGGIIGGMALGAVAGMAMANSPPPPRMVYAPPPPPPPVYVAPAPYAVVPAVPVYGSYYGGW
ncbi:hypothetical protein [Acetobacter sp.]|jgi:hypothetical protein|uniref:hypothetical protein n=1 Tax=Acetobacter sp. TaxID=440 RepID=UPI0025BA5C61|nr:hypothetical protein [Acetobacter sp.]MCH4092626.1 hypothetical protein [Acetobacter sp.]MCI1299760.1 hypothetical protein [Acetobacter sp.]MCI1315360.1 hypothetical protein [Acetobacter sp.]